MVLDWVKKLPNYDKKYKKTPILKVLGKNPHKLKSIIGFKAFNKKQKFLALLERGMPTKHIQLILDLSLDDLKEIKEIYAEELASYSLKHTFYEEIGKFMLPSRQKRFIQAAMASLQFKDWDEAQDTFELVLQHNSYNSDASFGLGCIHDVQNMRNLALEWFVKAYILDPVEFLAALVILKQKKIF